MASLQGCALPKAPQSGCGFVLQDADDEWEMRLKCPEIGGGNAESGKLKIVIGGWDKRRAFLSSLTGLAPGRSVQPTVGNGGLLSVVPAGLQRWARRHSAPTPSRMRDGEGRGLRNPGISRMGLEIDVTRCSGRMCNAFRMQDCQEFEWGADGGGRGVKAPEGWRSPRPGGLRGGLEHVEQPWGLRRRMNEANRGVMGRPRMPKSGCGFVLQDADDEWEMRLKCPEIGGDNAESGKLKIVIGGWDKRRAFLSSLTGLAPGRSVQPTVGNGGLLSVVPAGLQRWARRHSAPTPSRMRDGEGRGQRNSGISRMGLGIDVTSCSGRMCNAFRKVRTKGQAHAISRRGNPRTAGCLGLLEDRFFRGGGHGRKPGMEDPTESCGAGMGKGE